MIVIDAGTTWSKIIENSDSDYMKNFSSFKVKDENNIK